MFASWSVAASLPVTVASSAPVTDPLVATGAWLAAGGVVGGVVVVGGRVTGGGEVPDVPGPTGEVVGGMVGVVTGWPFS